MICSFWCFKRSYEGLKEAPQRANQLTGFYMRATLALNGLIQKNHLNNSKLHLDLKVSGKLRDLFINSIKKMYSIWCSHIQIQSSCNKVLTHIKNNLTDDKIDSVLEKVTITRTLNIAYVPYIRRIWRELF